MRSDIQLPACQAAAGSVVVAGCLETLDRVERDCAVAGPGGAEDSSELVRPLLAAWEQAKAIQDDATRAQSCLMLMRHYQQQGDLSSGEQYRQLAISAALSFQAAALEREIHLLVERQGAERELKRNLSTHDWTAALDSLGRLACIYRELGAEAAAAQARRDQDRLSDWLERLQSNPLLN